MPQYNAAYTATMNKKQKIDLSYLLWTLLPLAVGGLSALISADGMKNNTLLPQPALQPPPWVFITAMLILFLEKTLPRWFLSQQAMM